MASLNTNAIPARPSGFWLIAGRIWALWVIILFTVTMVLFMIPFLLFSYFLSDPKKTQRWHILARIWMGIFLPLAGTPLRVRGKEKFVKGQPYIVLCNHNAFIDVPASYPGIPGPNKTIAKIEMSRIPLFGLMYKTGSVLVDRKSEASRRESVTKMKEVLEMGLHMCLYPEGTRNKTDQPLKSFHDGAFRLALMTGKPLMPAVLFNSRKIMPNGVPFYFRPCRMGMHFLDPIQPQPGDTVDTLKQKAYDVMQEYYLRPTQAI